jgi:SAM-dependent methyltransferase
LAADEIEKNENLSLKLDFNFNSRRIDTRTRMRVVFGLFSKKDEPSLAFVCGCGVGVECKAFRDRGVSVVGLDVNREAIRVANSNMPGGFFVIGSATHLPFKDGSYSRIVCSAVLEHIRDDKRAILEMERTLMDGKELVITVPRRRHSRSDVRFLQEVEEKFGHVREGYTVEDIKSLLRGGKLTVVKFKLYWGPLHWLMLGLFERMPVATKGSVASAISTNEAKDVKRILRARALDMIILFLTVVSHIDSVVPFPSSHRFGMGVLMRKIRA